MAKPPPAGAEPPPPSPAFNVTSPPPPVEFFPPPFAFPPPPFVEYPSPSPPPFIDPFSIQSPPPGGTICFDCSQNNIVTDSSIIFSILAGIVLGLISLIGFSFLWKHVRVYTSRLSLEQVSFKPPSVPQERPWWTLERYWGWLIPIFTIPTKGILACAGMDAVILLKTIEFGFQLFVPMAVVSSIILLPIHQNGGVLAAQKDKDSSSSDKLNVNVFMQFTIANLPEGSSRMWVHFFMSYAFVLYGLWLMYWHYKGFASLLSEYNSAGENYQETKALLQAGVRPIDVARKSYMGRRPTDSHELRLMEPTVTERTSQGSQTDNRTPVSTHGAGPPGLVSPALFENVPLRVPAHLRTTEELMEQGDFDVERTAPSATPRGPQLSGLSPTGSVTFDPRSVPPSQHGSTYATSRRGSRAGSVAPTPSGKGLLRQVTKVYNTFKQTLADPLQSRDEGRQRERGAFSQALRFDKEARRTDASALLSSRANSTIIGGTSELETARGARPRRTEPVFSDSLDAYDGDYMSAFVAGSRGAANRSAPYLYDPNAAFDLSSGSRASFHPEGALEDSRGSLPSARESLQLSRRATPDSAPSPGVRFVQTRAVAPSLLTKAPSSASMDAPRPSVAHDMDASGGGSKAGKHVAQPSFSDMADGVNLAAVDFNAMLIPEDRELRRDGSISFPLAMSQSNASPRSPHMARADAARGGNQSRAEIPWDSVANRRSHSYVEDTIAESSEQEQPQPAPASDDTPQQPPSRRSSNGPGPVSEGVRRASRGSLLDGIEYSASVDSARGATESDASVNDVLIGQPSDSGAAPASTDGAELMRRTDSSRGSGPGAQRARSAPTSADSNAPQAADVATYLGSGSAPASVRPPRPAPQQMLRRPSQDAIANSAAGSFAARGAEAELTREASAHMEGALPADATVFQRPPSAAGQFGSQPGEGESRAGRRALRPPPIQVAHPSDCMSVDGTSVPGSFDYNLHPISEDTSQCALDRTVALVQEEMKSLQLARNGVTSDLALGPSTPGEELRPWWVPKDDGRHETDLPAAVEEKVRQKRIWFDPKSQLSRKPSVRFRKTCQIDARDPGDARITTSGMPPTAKRVIMVENYCVLVTDYPIRQKSVDHDDEEDFGSEDEDVPFMQHGRAEKSPQEHHLRTRVWDWLGSWHFGRSPATHTSHAGTNFYDIEHHAPPVPTKKGKASDMAANAPRTDVELAAGPTSGKPISESAHGSSALDMRAVHNPLDAGPFGAGDGSNKQADNTSHSGSSTIGTHLAMTTSLTEAPSAVFPAASIDIATSVSLHHFRATGPAAQERTSDRSAATSVLPDDEKTDVVWRENAYAQNRSSGSNTATTSASGNNGAHAAAPMPDLEARGFAEGVAGHPVAAPAHRRALPPMYAMSSDSSEWWDDGSSARSGHSAASARRSVFADRGLDGRPVVEAVRASDQWEQEGLEDDAAEPDHWATLRSKMGGITEAGSPKRSGAAWQRQQAALRVQKAFEEVFPQSTPQVLPVLNFQTVHMLLIKWDQAHMKLEHAQAKRDRRIKNMKKDPEPRHRLGFCGCFGPRVDSIPYWEKRIKELEAEIKEEQANAFETSLSVSYFVFFQSAADATIASQCVLHGEGSSDMRVQRAPGPDDVNWPVLWKTRSSRRWRFPLTLLMYVAIMAVPLGVFAGLLTGLKGTLCDLAKSSSDTSKQSGYSKYVCSPESFGEKVFTQIGPAILVILWQNAVMPLTLYSISQVQSTQVSLSGLDCHIMALFFQWHVFNIFLGGLIAGSISSQINRMIQNPQDIMTILGVSMPTSSNFFINYLALRALGLVPFRMILPHGGIWRWLFKCGGACAVMTKREEAGTWAPASIRYGREMGVMMLVFVIAWAYAVVSPVVLCLAAIYFMGSWIVWKWQVLYICVRIYEGGGKMWRTVVKCMLMCMIIFVYFTICVFIAKKAYWQAAIIFLTLPIVVWQYGLYLQARFDPALKFIPLEEAVKKPSADLNNEIMQTLNLMYTPAPLRPGCVGWHPEWGKVWEGWGCASYTAFDKPIPRKDKKSKSYQKLGVKP